MITVDKHLDSNAGLYMKREAYLFTNQSLLDLSFTMAALFGAGLWH